MIEYLALFGGLFLSFIGGWFARSALQARREDRCDSYLARRVQYKRPANIDDYSTAMLILKGVVKDE